MQHGWHHTVYGKLQEEVRITGVACSKRREQSDAASVSKISAIWTLAGELTWAGCAATQVTLAGSLLQQWISRLTVKDICGANAMVKEMWNNDPYIIFRAPKAGTVSTVYSYSDASFNINKSISYGQSRILNGIAFMNQDEMHPVYHVIDWASSKHRRVSHSFYGADILACTDKKRSWLSPKKFSGDYISRISIFALLARGFKDAVRNHHHIAR